MSGPYLTDYNILPTDPTFVSRVTSALLLYGNNTVLTEAASTANHQARVLFLRMVVNSGGFAAFGQRFAYGVALDATVIGLATASGATTLTTGNVATQAALVTDAAIENAVANLYTSLVQ